MCQERDSVESAVTLHGIACSRVVSCGVVSLFDGTELLD